LEDSQIARELKAISLRFSLLMLRTGPVMTGAMPSMLIKYLQILGIPLKKLLKQVS